MALPSLKASRRLSVRPSSRRVHHRTKFTNTKATPLTVLNKQATVITKTNPKTMQEDQ